VVYAPAATETGLLNALSLHHASWACTALLHCSHLGALVVGTTLLGRNTFVVHTVGDAQYGGVASGCPWCSVCSTLACGSMGIGMQKGPSVPLRLSC
jgi:hypothetical protein